MKKFWDRYLRNEDGAVTVEWVVLTAAIIGLTIGAYNTINSGSSTMASNTDDTLTTMTVGNPVIGE